MESIEDTIGEIFKVDPKLAICIMQLTANAMLLVYGSDNVLTQTAINDQYRRIKDILRDIDDNCIYYVAKDESGR
ncbi:hypothetical protein [Sporomusa aerivorans]|uniref:hypothetical protein n=1 Tax=Sporomusa aerivorans TaxID=204936 RepID=UPI00352B3FD8